MTIKLQRIVRTMIALVLVTALGIAGVFAAAWLWPLPKGQGLAYVAHPFYALVGCGAAAIGAAVASIVYPDQWLWWTAGGLALTWCISALIFFTA